MRAQAGWHNGFSEAGCVRRDSGDYSHNFTAHLKLLWYTFSTFRARRERSGKFLCWWCHRSRAHLLLKVNFFCPLSLRSPSSQLLCSTLTLFFDLIVRATSWCGCCRDYELCHWGPCGASYGRYYKYWSMTTSSPQLNSVVSVEKTLRTDPSHHPPQCQFTGRAMEQALSPLPE